MIAGVLLAAGSSTRFRGEFAGRKLLAPLDARGDGVDVAVGVVAARALVAALPRVIAVVRPGDAALASALGAAGCAVVECARAGDGMGASLAHGVRSVAGARGWIVALADMPWVSVATIAAVRDAIAGGAVVAAPFHAGQRGHPVGFAAACYAELVACEGDQGARRVLLHHASALVRIDVDDQGVLRDVDTRADLA